MGCWGAGLYDDDFASDLKPLVSTLLSLPISLDDIAAKLAKESGGRDGTPVSLIFSDILEKRGLRHGPTFATARKVVESGSDLKRLRRLGMTEPDLRKRVKVLSDLAARLDAPRPEKPRKTLAHPKPCPVSAGDVLVYPVGRRDPNSDLSPLNPYLSAALLEKHPFVATAWGAALVTDIGFAFDYLPWVAVRVAPHSFEEKPTLKDVSPAIRRAALGYGTLSPSHFRKMKMEIIGNDPSLIRSSPILFRQAAAKAGQANGEACAIADISVSNRLNVRK